LVTQQLLTASCMNVNEITTYLTTTYL